jgi:hypothetical protein
MQLTSSAVDRVNQFGNTLFQLDQALLFEQQLLLQAVVLALCAYFRLFLLVERSQLTGFIFRDILQAMTRGEVAKDLLFGTSKSCFCLLQRFTHSLHLRSGLNYTQTQTITSTWRTPILLF